MSEDPWEKRGKQMLQAAREYHQREEGTPPSVSEITQGIIADLTARDLKGQREYGTTMDRADLTPLEWLDHEYSELLDAAQYNRAARRKVAEMEMMIEDLRDKLTAARLCAEHYENEVRRLKGEEVVG